MQYSRDRNSMKHISEVLSNTKSSASEMLEYCNDKQDQNNTAMNSHTSQSKVWLADKYGIHCIYINEDAWGQENTLIKYE